MQREGISKTFLSCSKSFSIMTSSLFSIYFKVTNDDLDHVVSLPYSNFGSLGYRGFGSM